MKHQPGVASMAFVVSFFLCGLLSACNLPRSDAPASPLPTSPPPTASTGEGPQVELALAAIRLNQGQVTYSAVLRNTGPIAAGEVTLELGLPDGSEDVEAVGLPALAQVGHANGQVTWSMPSIPSFTAVGPFAVRVNALDPPAVEATASWKFPFPGAVQDSIEVVEDATKTHASLSLSAGRPQGSPGTGIEVFVPFGDHGAGSLTRIEDKSFPDADEVTWLAMYRVDQDQSGSVLLTVPLHTPAVPGTGVRVFLDQGQGWAEQSIRGTVAGDGLHAAFSADATGDFALGAATDIVAAGLNPIGRDQSDILGGLAAEGLTLLDSILAQIEGLTSLFDSLRTEDGGVIVVETGNGWLVLTLPDEDEDPEGTGTAGCETSGGATTCVEPEGSGDACEGHGGGVTTYYSNGDSHSTCADGTEVDVTCVDEDDDDVCSVDDEDDNDPYVDFAPVPGPCPHAVCFTGDDEAAGFGIGQIDGLPSTVIEMLQLDGFSVADRLQMDPPAVQEVQAPGPRLDASGLQAQVAMLGDAVVLVIPSGQSVQPVVWPASYISAPPIPAPSATPLPTSRPLAMATNTPTLPPPDTSGPSVKSVSDSPDPIKVTQPKGCTPTTSTISAAISDPSGVASASVLFFHTTIGQVPMTHGGGSTWTATLGPFSGIGDGTVDYQIRAVDGVGNTADSSFGQIAVLACIP